MSDMYIANAMCRFGVIAVVLVAGVGIMVGKHYFTSHAHHRSGGRPTMPYTSLASPNGAGAHAAYGGLNDSPSQGGMGTVKRLQPASSWNKNWEAEDEAWDSAERGGRQGPGGKGGLGRGAGGVGGVSSNRRNKSNPHDEW